jgi:hypothetical protein
MVWAHDRQIGRLLWCLGIYPLLHLLSQSLQTRYTTNYELFSIPLVYEGQTGLILKFGKYHRAVDPGLTRVNP